MKNFSTKKFLICTSALFFLFWGFLIYAVPPIMIDPARFVATVRIQQVNLYYRVESEHDTELSKDDIVKAWMTNYWWINRWVLYIRPVDASGDLVDETNNTILNPDHTSIIGWQMNTNRWDETSMILWGSMNTVDWHWVVLLWWDNNTALVDNAMILWSANSTVWSSNGAILAADGWNVQWRNSTIFWGGWNIYAWADNVFSIAWGANIAHQWIFSYGSTVSNKPNIAQFNVWQGIIVWWLKPNWNDNIKLSVNWALAVWRGKCTREMIWSVYYKPWFSKCPARGGEPERMVPAYCLCSCVASWTDAKAVALSNQPYCDNLCACESDDPTQCLLWPAKCWERWLEWTPKVYVSWQKWWQKPSKFCADNRSPIAYYIYSVDESGKKSETPKQSKECPYSSSDCEPPFPWTWEEVKWVCAWPAYCTQVECSAYREKEAPELAECWKNARRYKAAEQKFTWSSESDFCKRLNPWAWASDRAHNGLLSAFTGLSKDQVQQLITTGFDISYISWELEDWFELSHLTILSHLNSAFPDPWERTYWKCQTSNAAYEVEWSEIVNETECYAERLECNSCAKDGFPYCFNVDFSDNCDCNDPVKCPVACIPWTDNAWNYYLHVNWDSTGSADTLNADSNSTKVKSQSPKLKASIDGNRVIYEFPRNTSDEVKLYTASFSATGDVNYCDSWTTTIYQCPKWFVFDEVQNSCVQEWYTIRFVCWSSSPSKMPDQHVQIWKEVALNKNVCEYSWHAFSWWSKNENATVIDFRDQENVKDLWNPWSIVNLYAVWENESIVAHYDCNWKSWNPEDQLFYIGVAKKLYNWDVCTSWWATFLWWSTIATDSVWQYSWWQTIRLTTKWSWRITFYAIWKAAPAAVYECMWEVPKDDDPNKYILVNPSLKPNKKWTHYFLAFMEEFSQPCAYKCWPWYTLLVLDWLRYCAKCKPWTTPDYEHWICTYEGDVTCPSPYVWFENLNVCAIPGACSYYSKNKEQTAEEMQPLYNAAGLTQSKCVKNSAWVEQNKCQFSCKKWYICNRYGNECIKPSCYYDWYTDPVYTVDHFADLYSYIEKGKEYNDALKNPYYPNRDSVLKNNIDYAAFKDTNRYINLNPEIKKWESYRYTFRSVWDRTETMKQNIIEYHNPSMENEDRFFVIANSESEFRNKVNWLTGCFFWCTWSYYQKNYDGYEGDDFTCWLPLPSWGDWNNPWNHGWNSNEPERETNLCASINIYWPYWTSKTLWFKSQHSWAPYSWTWDTYASRNENAFCHAWCLEWFQRKVEDGNYYCWKKCQNNQYYDSSTFECKTCPDGSYPDTSLPDAFWNAQSCWKNCNEGLDSARYISVNNNCVLCPVWETPDTSSTDSHWNPTRCKNVCKDDEAYLTWYNNCWKGVNECCLPAVHNPNSRSCNAEDSECWTLENWTTCACPLIY